MQDVSHVVMHWIYKGDLLQFDTHIIILSLELRKLIKERRLEYIVKILVTKDGVMDW
jgi:hypothetical protein